jgi:hypothetical protein
MPGDVFVQRKPSETLEQFREVFCVALCVARGEQRFSDNRAGGTYFRTECLGIRVQIEEADDSAAMEYHFHVHFRPRLQRSLGTAEKTIMEGVADLVARELTTLGYVVLRLSPNPSNPDGDRIRRRCAVTDADSTPQFFEE